MSRDWTPREQLAAEVILEGRTWLDVSRGMTITHNGKEFPMCPAEYCDFLEQFNYLKRVGYDAVYPLYIRYGGKCFSVIQEIEEALTQYIENGVRIKSWVCDWFDGKLDPGFYYSAHNNECFLAEAERMFRP